MLPLLSSRLVSTSQICNLAVRDLLLLAQPHPANCTSSFNPSTRAQIISIYCTSSASSIPLPQHLLHPQASISSVADVFSLSVSFPGPYSVSIFFSHSLCISWEHQICISTNHHTSCLVLFLPHFSQLQTPPHPTFILS